MSAQHTPGPWEFRMYAGVCTIVSAHNAPGRSTRDALKGVTVTVDAFIFDDQSNANEASLDARLLLAAPLLLAALRACNRDDLSIVRAAIAKATGAAS